MKKPLDKSNPKYAAHEFDMPFLAICMIPFNTPNDPRFRHLLNAFEPRYTLPDRKTIAIRYVQDLFQREKSRVL